MAPIPYTPNARLQLAYVVSPFSHKANFPVRWNGSDSLPKLWSHSAVDYTNDPQDLATQIWSFAKAFFPASVLAPGWTLYSYVSGDFIPVTDGAATGGVGTNTNPEQSCGQLSITFKDEFNQRFNSYWFETCAIVPNKGPVGAYNIVNDYAADVLDYNTFGSIGNSLVSRGDGKIIVAKNFTSDLNRALRKRRGFA
jgi:hypothetical protein